LLGFERWATEHNPAFDGPYADLIGLLPIVVASIVLYLVGRDWFMRNEHLHSDGLAHLPQQ
jgi:hypothetical protein